MSQHVNFLKSLPQKSNVLPALQIGIASLALLLICVLLSTYIGIKQFFASLDYDRALKARQEASANFDKWVLRFPLLASDRPLLEVVTEFEKSLRDKEAHFAKLSHATSRRPFSKFMKTLSQTAPEGLWLTEINIDQDSENISLRGYSLRPINVSLFLEGLQNSTAFSGVVFDLFYVKKIKDKDYVQFEIANDKLSSYEETPKKGINKEEENSSERKPD